MRLSIKGVHFIGMQKLSHEEQADVLQVQSEGFMTEQTEIPLDKQGETECLSANTEHSPPRQPDSKCITI